MDRAWLGDCLPSKAQVLTFLASHNPMPPDSELSDELCEEYDQAVRFIARNPSPDLIRPLLNSFGRWGGRGMYQVAIDVFSEFMRYAEDLAGELGRALESEHDSVRYWAAQIAQDFGGGGHVPSLERLLADPNEDIRVASATALGALGSVRSVPLLEVASEGMTRESAELIGEIVADLIE